MLHGGWNFPLIIQGTGFVPGSHVTWNGHSLAVDYLSSAKLKVYVPASAIASAGTATIVVANPALKPTLAAALTSTFSYTIK